MLVNLVYSCTKFSTYHFRMVFDFRLRVLELLTYSCDATLVGTASTGNDGAGAVDCDSRRAVGPIRTIRGVYMTQLNPLQRLVALSAPNEWSFYV